jgi:hypothetical protein
MCPLFLQLHSQNNLTTLHSCNPHLQGWHHPSRNQKSNSPWPYLQGWKIQLPFCIKLAHAPPPTTVPNWHPLSVTHQSLLAPDPTQHYPSPLPAPPAANTHLPSLPTRLPQPAPSTEQHQSLIKTRAISLNGANGITTSPPLLLGTPPMQMNWGAFAKALPLVPMKANVSKAPTPSSPFPTTRSHPIAAEKSPTPRSFARSDQGREMMPTAHATPLAETTLLILEM